MRLSLLRALGLAWALALALPAQVARTGEVYAAPGQVFKVVFKQPGSRDFAKFVADTLQKAWETYNADFARDDGKAPLGWLSPANRMEVQLVPIGGGINAYYQFLSWNGYIQVDPGIGEKDLPGLRITLCHELFHALQDAYSNMMVSGNRAHWWFEASAEWAGLKYGSPYTADQARDEMLRYKYFLSLPVQESEKYEDRLMAYAFAMMVEHAETKSPGYVRRALNGSAVTSRAFYEELVKASNFPETFPEYVGTYLKVGFSNPGLWTTARVVESEGETRIYRAGEALGSQEEAHPERISDDKQRAAPLTFPARVELPPLTARLYAVSTTGLKQARTLTVRLRQPSLSGPVPSDRAVVLKVPPSPSPASWSRLSGGTAKIQGLGKDLSEVCVAVVNPDPWLPMTYELELALDKDLTPGVEFLLDPPAFETMNGETRQWQDGPNGATPTSKWKVEPEGLWFDSTQDRFHLEASWTKPPQSLKQGDSFLMDITLTVDGARGAELQFSPMGPMAEWELEALNPGPEVRKAGFNAYVLSLPPGKGRRSASVRVKVSLPGPWRTVNLKTGEGSGGRRKITIDPLELAINVNNLGRIRWLYARKGRPRWWEKK